MSSITHIQTPVHTYGHQSELHFDYEFTGSSYSADSRFLADNYAHMDDLPVYKPGCSSYVPYGFESTEFDETDEAQAFVYSTTHNNSFYHASPGPQLVCPRPSLLPSQLSPHFSWDDWPSEAPANVYHAERSQLYASTSLIFPLVPQAQTGEMKGSLRNQQYTSTSNPLASSSSYLGDGCTESFRFVAPTGIQSFDQVPSLPSPYITALAHQPVTPEQHSLYSELAPNLKFIESQMQSPCVRNEPSHSSTQARNDGTIAKGTISLPDEKNPFALGFDGPPLTAYGRRKFPLKTSYAVSSPGPLNSHKTT